MKSHLNLFASILKKSELFPGSRLYCNLALIPSSASSAFEKDKKLRSPINNCKVVYKIFHDEKS